MAGYGKASVLVAVYGNVGEGIVLKELDAYTRNAGLRTIAAASFIVEHSFSNETISIAEGRPDKRDLQIASSFGKKVLEKASQIDDLEDLPELELNGNLPFMAKILPKNSASFFTRETEADMSKCTKCGICVRKCPAGAIHIETLSINKDLCLRCFACVKKCPFAARKIMYKKKWLVTRFLKRITYQRKEPAMYL